jgi:hypothetical protein
MIYYRVKPEYDGRTIYKRSKQGDCYIPSGYFVGNELFTPKERKEITAKDFLFDRVEISRKRIGWLFGARFPLDDFGPKCYN